MLRNKVIIFGLVLILFAGLRLTTGPTMVIYEGNVLLGNPTNSGVLLLAGNINLPADGRIGGDLLILCCNAAVHGEVHGDIALLTGNLLVGPTAEIGGGLRVGSTNVTVSPQATIQGNQNGIGLGFWLLLLWHLLPPWLPAFLGMISLMTELRRHLLLRKRNAQAHAGAVAVRTFDLE